MKIGFKKFYNGTAAKKLRGCIYGCCLNISPRRLKKESHRRARRTLARAAFLLAED